MKSIRIGSGAGYAGDRLEPALELIEKGDLDYIMQIRRYYRKMEY